MPATGAPAFRLLKDFVSGVPYKPGGVIGLLAILDYWDPRRFRWFTSNPYSLNLSFMQCVYFTKSHTDCQELSYRVTGIIICL